MTILQRVTFWLALRLLASSTREADDIFSPNARFMRTKIRPSKSTKTIGSSNATPGAKVGGSISPKRSLSCDRVNVPSISQPVSRVRRPRK